MPTEIKQANMLKEIISNRKLIWDLSKNDFKTRFAGSYLGIIWAFVQPIVTVLVYWFVFEKGMHASGINLRSGITAPFVLWLIAGLVPWFFFQEVLSGGTNALMEYSYLVKKVVFQIDILPIIKLISALFVHLFFIAFAIFIYIIMGKTPIVQMAQLGYYTICAICLITAIAYFTCSIVPFFRDFGTIINILMQVGMWACPIMWDMSTFKMPAKVEFLLKLNPLYYVVQGYRDSFMDGIWFFERPKMTIYFWVVTLIIGVIGFTVFRRLRVHFSDVL